MEGNEFAGIEEGTMTFEKLRFEPAPDGERTDIIGFYRRSRPSASGLDPEGEGRKPH